MTNFKFIYFTRLLSLGLLLQNITVSGVPYSESDLYEYMSDQSDDAGEDKTERTEPSQTPTFKSEALSLVIDSLWRTKL